MSLVFTKLCLFIVKIVFLPFNHNRWRWGSPWKLCQSQIPSNLWKIQKQIQREKAEQTQHQSGGLFQQVGYCYAFKTRLEVIAQLVARLFTANSCGYIEPDWKRTIYQPKTDIFIKPFSWYKGDWPYRAENNT